MALPKIKPIPSPQGFTRKGGGLSNAGYESLQSLVDGVRAALSQVSESTAANYQANTPGFLALTPETVWSAVASVGLTDAATIAVDFGAGFNFDVTIAGNRTLGNPSNLGKRQSGVFEVTASGATRTLAFSSNYIKTSDVTVPVSIPSGQTALIYYHVTKTGKVHITSVAINPT